jgi:hypothetical protein
VLNIAQCFVTEPKQHEQAMKREGALRGAKSERGVSKVGVRRVVEAVDRHPHRTLQERLLWVVLR